MQESYYSLQDYWLKELNNVSGRVETSFKGWLSNKNYQIYSPLAEESFMLNIQDKSEPLVAYAYDINRFSCSSFETMCLINKSKILPKSLGWLIIKCYYSAFFAAENARGFKTISTSSLI